MMLPHKTRTHVGRNLLPHENQLDEVNELTDNDMTNESIEGVMQKVFFFQKSSDVEDVGRKEFWVSRTECVSNK